MALGANLGDPVATLGAAVGALATLGCVDAASRPWATDPVGGPPGQPPYLNAVVRWHPAPPWATPERSLAALLAIEAGLGRRRRERWGPRLIDLDLLDGRGWRRPPRRAPTADLTLPHPRAGGRAFVLVPWAEIAPDWPAPPAAGAPAEAVGDRARRVDRGGVHPAEPAVLAAWKAALTGRRVGVPEGGAARG
ncbi:MAG: 2-amino-4-hydroxy-6-hydroxymethyldihydropteridine diphosphokinase [Trueperaceae bacterium]|nr:2-amino-4-hydroxy-6-hydroxymethyldihydropteridine diphosphokinase [Trueperaceae bacterium]